jgi:hypothetical protein
VYDKLNGVQTMPKYFSENGYVTFANAFVESASLFLSAAAAS